MRFTARLLCWAGVILTLLAGTTCDAAATRSRHSGPVQQGSDYGKRTDVSAFVEELATRYDFDRKSLRKTFAQVKTQNSALRAMNLPIAQPPKWYEYAPHLVNDERTEMGVSFWHANARTLVTAEADFGVPPEIIVAIIGVETFYGRMPGRYRVMDALTTLAFDYPRRAEFFRKELTEFLLLCREQHLSPLVPRGSFAGAMGMPQFMPATFRDYAIDYDQDGRIDIWRNSGDSIGSVANFLQWHGWQRGGPVLVRTQVDDELALAELSGGLTPRHTVAEWKRAGVHAPPDFSEEAAAALVMLEEPADDTYWLGFNNFYVLTRYNRSRLYAAAVFSLSARIREAYAAAYP